VARPQGAPGRSRRAQRAQRALPEPGSVPCPSSHTSASSAAPPAIEAGRDASAGRGGAMRGGRARPTRARKARPQGRARGEPAAQVPWAAPQPMAVVRACWTDGRPARRPRGVQGARLSSRRGPPRRPRALGRHDGATGERSCARKRVVGIFFRGIKNGCLGLPWSQRSRSEAEHAQRRSAATQSRQQPPARASSLGASRCWLVTTPLEGRSERYATAPRSLRRLPRPAQNGYQDSAYLAVAPRAAWPHRRSNTAERDSMPASKMPKSPSSPPGTNLRCPAHSLGPARLV
jgi:hypothetical protein